MGAPDAAGMDQEAESAHLSYKQEANRANKKCRSLPPPTTTTTKKKKSEPMEDIRTHLNHSNGQYLTQRDSHVAFSNIDNCILGVK